MRNIQFLLCGLAAAIITLSCGTRSGKKASSETKVVQETETCITAIDKYLSEVIGSQYAPGEVCIPSHRIIAVDESNPDDIQVWGDFWVDNFNVVGDTLMAVSGGSHPGKMHIIKDSEGHLTVTAFEAVGDGSSFTPTAKAIFGDRFDEFQKVNSDNVGREEARKSAIAAHVFKNNLPVKVYKDYGWPAVEIPKMNAKTESTFFREVQAQIPAYARMNRQTKMAAGAIPAPMSTLVHTKVTPQMATIRRARR